MPEKARETYCVVSDEGKKAEGLARQRKASVGEEHEQRKRTRAERDETERAESRATSMRERTGALRGQYVTLSSREVPCGRSSSGRGSTGSRLARRCFLRI
jgi:hypothetical protein